VSAGPCPLVGKELSRPAPWVDEELAGLALGWAGSCTQFPPA